MNKIDCLNKKDLLIVAKKATSLAEILRYFNIPVKGAYTALLRKKLILLDFNLEKLKSNYFKKHNNIKICPVCKKHFTQRKGEKQKICCCTACANTHFRSGLNNPGYKKKANYRTKCFHYHKYECIICGEKNIVAVHHFDENHKNNDVTNLIPLCPTHHNYMHSKYKTLILDKVLAYKKQFEQDIA